MPFMVTDPREKFARCDSRKMPGVFQFRPGTAKIDLMRLSTNG